VQRQSVKTLRKVLAISKGGALEIRDEHFFIAAASFLLRGVEQLDVTELELLEDSPHLGDIVQGKHEFCLQTRETLRHFLEVLCSEIVSIELQTEIRRVEVEECFRSIESLKDLFIREILKLHSRKSLVRLLDDFGKTFRIKSWRLRNVAFIVQVADQSGVAIFQEKQMSSSALDVGERPWIGRLEQLMPLPAHEHEAQIANQFLVMLLADAEKVHHLAVEIV